MERKGRRAVRIYTRRGDRGETGLLRPRGAERRVRKDDRRVEAFGALDELESWIGYVAAEVPEEREALRRCQEVLFHVAYDAATVSDPPPATVTAEDVRDLEADIDALEARLPPLGGFVVPGGSRRQAIVHVARTVCRRAERRLVTLAASEAVNPQALAYVNRLSDYLFVLAREVGRRDGADEVHVRWRL
jgi:cob(I)alamin adenosyltransferase